MRRYPVYYEGKKIGNWDPIDKALWEFFLSKVVIPDSVYRSDFLPIFEKDKVTIVKRLAGEVG